MKALSLALTVSLGLASVACAGGAAPMKQVVSIPVSAWGNAVDTLPQALSLPAHASPAVLRAVTSLIQMDQLPLEATRINGGPVVLVPEQNRPGAAGAILPQEPGQPALFADIGQISARLRTDIEGGKIDEAYASLAERFDQTAQPARKKCSGNGCGTCAGCPVAALKAAKLAKQAQPPQ